MCGICGFTGALQNDVQRDTAIQKMTDTIKHRGPDDMGYYKDSGITLGFRRLSFLDLSDGHQPMFNKDRSLVIIFNGEIYNFRDLREYLINCGYQFNTTSDTEVILYLYEKYGEKLLDHLRGMFAFVIYEITTGKVFAARDFFGIKPFYYTEVEGQLVFASEIKAITHYPRFEKQVNHNALANYLTFQYSALEETFFKNVYKLMPGHYLIYESGKLSTHKYYNVEFAPQDKPLEQSINEIDKIIGDSIEHHKVSDVEIGSFLSSGVDSGLLAARFGGEKTFTVGFDYEDYNEISYAQDLCAKKGLTNYSKIITTEEYWAQLPNIQYHMDEPLADASAIALYFVSQIAKEHVKGVISGEGADEFFGGYNIYKEPLSLKPIQTLPKTFRKALAAIIKKLPINFKGKNYIIRGSQTLQQRFIGNAKIFTEDERAKILKNKGTIGIYDITGPIYTKAQEYDDITKMQFLDIHLWLVGDILLKADKMSMAHSLEVRVPYLDKEVFNVAKTLPTNQRVNKQSTKYAFRKSANRYLDQNAANKKKLGFPVPIRIWLREEKYYNKVKSAFEDAHEFFDTKELLNVLEQHKSGKADNSRKIWTVYMFLVWHSQYFTQQKNQLV